MPAPPFINGLINPYNRVFLSSLRAHSVRLASEERTRKVRTNIVSAFVMRFISHNELSEVLKTFIQKKYPERKLT
jgi:hypothetical protein